MRGQEQEGCSNGGCERLSALEAAAQVKREVMEIENERPSPPQRPCRGSKKSGKSKNVDDSLTRSPRTCRICLEPISKNDFKTNKALSLGCK